MTSADAAFATEICPLAANYDELYQWSVEHYSDFWAEFWKFSGIVFSRLYDEVGRSVREPLVVRPQAPLRKRCSLARRKLDPNVSGALWVCVPQTWRGGGEARLFTQENRIARGLLSDPWWFCADVMSERAWRCMLGKRMSRALSPGLDGAVKPQFKIVVDEPFALDMGSKDPVVGWWLASPLPCS